MDRELELERGAGRVAGSRAPDGGVLEGKEHTAVALDLPPLMLDHQLLLKKLELRLSARIGRSQSIRRRQRHPSPSRPIIHILDIR